MFYGRDTNLFVKMPELHKCRLGLSKWREKTELICILVVITIFSKWTADGINCPTTNFPSFNYMRVISYNAETPEKRQFVVYECITGFQYDNNTEGILWCNQTTGTWTGSPGICRQSDPCIPNPCLNGGLCSTSEDPFKTGYYCWCVEDFGGRRCQIANPCSSLPCPSPGVYCFRSFIDESGRYCYDSNWARVL